MVHFNELERPATERVPLLKEAQILHSKTNNNAHTLQHNLCDDLQEFLNIFLSMIVSLLKESFFQHFLLSKCIS